MARISNRYRDIGSRLSKINDQKIIDFAKQNNCSVSDAHIRLLNRAMKNK